MGLYSAHFSVAGVNTANSAIFNLKTAASDRAAIREIGVFIATAPTNAPDVALARMSAVGTGTITSVAGQAHDTGDGTATAVLETAWATTRPTFGAVHFRRGTIPLAVGSGFIWAFGGAGLVVPVSAGVVLANIAAAGATLGVLAGYVSWEE